MAWVQWKDGVLVSNTLHTKQGAGDDWKEVFDEVGDITDVSKKLLFLKKVENFTDAQKI